MRACVFWETSSTASCTTAIKLLVITFFRVRFATLDFSFLVLVYGVWGVIFLFGSRGHAGSLGKLKVDGLTRSGNRTEMLRETKNCVNDVLFFVFCGSRRYKFWLGLARKREHKENLGLQHTRDLGNRLKNSRESQN